MDTNLKTNRKTEAQAMDKQPAKMQVIAEPGKPEVIATCYFNYPRALIFKAYTEPKLVERWWGPRRYITIVDRLEARPGGQWRFHNRDDQGNDYAFHGFFHTVQAPEQMVFTFEFEGAPGHVLLETITLTEQGGGTLVTDQSIYQSVADRDMMVQTGMEEGARESIERLEELLVDLAGR